MFRPIPAERRAVRESRDALAAAGHELVHFQPPRTHEVRTWACCFAGGPCIHLCCLLSHTAGGKKRRTCRKMSTFEGSRYTTHMYRGGRYAVMHVVPHTVLHNVVAHNCELQGSTSITHASTDPMYSQHTGMNVCNISGQYQRGRPVHSQRFSKQISQCNCLLAVCNMVCYTAPTCRFQHLCP